LSKIGAKGITASARNQCGNMIKNGQMCLKFHSAVSKPVIHEQLTLIFTLPTRRFCLNAPLPQVSAEMRASNVKWRSRANAVSGVRGCRLRATAANWRLDPKICRLRPCYRDQRGALPLGRRPWSCRCWIGGVRRRGPSLGWCPRRSGLRPDRVPRAFDGRKIAAFGWHPRGR
jgi:hypothetical protein